MSYEAATTRKHKGIAGCAILVGIVLAGCSQQPGQSGKITQSQIQQMSGRPPTPDELRRAKESEARAIIPATPQDGGK